MDIFKIKRVPVLGIVDLHNTAHDIELHCKVERLLCLHNSRTLLGSLTGFFGSNLIFQLGSIELNVRYCCNFGVLEICQSCSALRITEHDGREVGCSIFDKRKFSNQLRALIIIQKLQHIINALTNLGEFGADVSKEILSSCKRGYGEDIHEVDHVTSYFIKRCSTGKSTSFSSHDDTLATLLQTYKCTLYTFREANHISF